MKIQKPSFGIVVHYTAVAEKRLTCIAFVAGVRERAAPGVVDLLVFYPKDFGPGFQPGEAEDVVVKCVRDVPHDAEAGRGTWRYPPVVREEIEVPS